MATGPGAAQAAACPSGVAADAAPVAASEASAQRLAAACDKPVEVLAEANETTRVVALPSGSFSFETYAEPQRVERAGRWIDLDTGLAQGADGRLRPRAAADVTFSAGGAGPFATLREGGSDFSLSWPTALPAGVVSGDTVTYPNVFPDVDLVARALAGGFSHVLVVRTAAAAANPAVRETSYRIGGSATVTEAGDEITIKGPRGIIAGAPPAAAWDSARRAAKPAAALLRGQAREAAPAIAADPSTAAAPGALAERAEVDVRVEGRELKVAVDETLLDADAQYPVYIDPTYDKAYQKWVPVSKSSPDTKWVSGNSWPRDVIRIGSNYDNYSDVWRAHVQFDISTLIGKRLIKTPSVDAYLLHTAWCAGESLSLWQTNTLDGNTPTWDGMSKKWLHGAALQTKTVKANGSCSGQTPNWAKFTAGGVKSNVQRHADAGYTTITFGLRVPTESGGHWIKAERGKVRLKAEFQSKPTSPVAVRSAPGGACNKTSPGPWLNDSTPALYGKAADLDNSVRVRFDLTGPTTPATDYTSAAVKSNSEGTYNTPALKDGAYKWRVQGYDGTDETAWTSYCYFRMDQTRPSLPVVTRTSGPPVLGQPVSLSFSSTDTGSGVQRFEYGVGVDTRQSSVDAAGGKASATVPTDSGRTQIYVWARDVAGNYSERAIYNFFTGRVTPVEPAGLYRMTYDLRDDSGNDHDLSLLGSGPAYGADQAGRGGAALTLAAGSGCATTDALVRTDAEFTVAGWVKLGEKGGANKSVLTQVGTVLPAFGLTYNAGADRWEAAVTSADASTATWTVARATVAPTLNVWQHVAATVDPAGKLLRLYLDGKPAAEVALAKPTWDAQARTLIGCGGSAAATNAPFVGSIDQLGVWSGLLSQAQIAAAANELPAGAVAAFALRGNGADSSTHGYELTVPPLPEPTPEPEPTEPADPEPTDPGSTEPPAEPDPEPTGPQPEPTDTPEIPEETPEPETPEPTPTTPPAQPERAPEWVDDAFGRTVSAWNVAGDRCATSNRSLVRTNESFSVSAWAKLTDPSTMNQTVLGEDGTRVSGWFLGARANAQGVPFWSLMMKGTDAEGAASEFAGTTTEAFAATIGKWTHLTGVYTASTKTMTLYVDGRKVTSVVRTGTNWSATGMFTVGCAKYAGVPADHFRGAIADVRVWRGALTDTEVAGVRGGNAPVKLEGMWPLDGPRADEPTNFDDRSGNARHLTVNGAYGWERDRFATRDGALGLALADGSCAQTAGPAVRTDGSFTVAAWVSLDELTGTRTVVAQSGGIRQGFRLEYSGAAARWRFVMPQGDTAAAAAVEIRSQAAPVAGVWTHLAAVYDLPAKTVQLYVDGEPQRETPLPAPAAPWHAPGPLTVGCAGSTSDGRRADFLGGVVDDVRVWTSTVNPDLFGTFAHA
ncbi:LamG domain-containing protein [Actinoplanes nipponensis]|uniref:LamG domain-containing protein n=1 Tax=Actinoplanes nipponensis TaxID=135950 RepID=UPI0019411B70|nr:LamG domain-containing protein [Actinoplanes nipponensis]